MSLLTNFTSHARTHARTTSHITPMCDISELMVSARLALFLPYQKIHLGLLQTNPRQPTTVQCFQKGLKTSQRKILLLKACSFKTVEP